MAETPRVPQNLSSDLAKAQGLPEVLKKSPINWEKVKKVDAGLDAIPDIHARGAKITISEQVDANRMREATKIRVGRENQTNLVDYVIQDEQMRVLLQEGMRLNVVSEQDFVAMGISPENFQKGAGKTNLEIPALSRLQKAEAISLILHRLGEVNPATTTQFLDEASKLVLNPKKVELLNEKGGVLDNQDLLNALAAGGREELSKYVLEQGYNPYSIGEKADERRVMAKLVEKAYGEEGPTRVLKEQTPYFADRKDVKLDTGEVVEGVPVAEYSGMLDIHIAQAMTNAMVPAEFHVAIAQLEQRLAKATTVAEKEDIRHGITRSKQKMYAALLNAFGAAGYEQDGEIFTRLGFGVEDQTDIMRMASTIKESRKFRETQNLTMFEANRANLANVAAEITGVHPEKLKVLVMTLPIEQTVEAMRESNRGRNISENALETVTREQLADSFIEVVVSRMGKKATLSGEQEDMLRTFFFRTYDTERSLIKKASRRFKEADAPTKVKIGTPEAVNQGVKGLDLLFRRSITEQQYDWETYSKLVIEGAANMEPQVPGAVLEQGEQKKAADRAEIDRAEEEAYAEKAVRENAEAQQKALEAAVEDEKNRQEQMVARQNRRPSESLALTDIPDGEQGEVYVNELYQKIDQGMVTSEDIQAEMNSVLAIPKGFEGMFRGPLKFFKERGLKKDADKLATYKGLKDALVVARQYEAIPADDVDGLAEARQQFFVPHKEEENPPTV